MIVAYPLAVLLAFLAPSVGLPLLVALLLGRALRQVHRYRAIRRHEERLRAAEIASWSTWPR